MFAWIPNPVNLPQNHHVCIRNRLCVNIFLSLVNIVAACQYRKVNSCIVVLSNFKRLFLKVTLFPKKNCNVQVFYRVEPLYWLSLFYQTERCYLILVSDFHRRRIDLLFVEKVRQKRAPVVAVMVVVPKLTFVCNMNTANVLYDLKVRLWGYLYLSQCTAQSFFSVKLLEFTPVYAIKWNVTLLLFFLSW